MKERERDGRDEAALAWLVVVVGCVCVCTLRIDFVRVPLGRPSAAAPRERERE